MPFRETPQGQTNFCKHREDHDVSKCEKCIPIKRPRCIKQLGYGNIALVCRYNEDGFCVKCGRELGADNDLTPATEPVNISNHLKSETMPNNNYIEDNRFESQLAVFIAFIEDEAKRIYEEKHGAHRRDGGRKMQCTLFLKQLLNHSLVTLIERQIEALKKRKIDRFKSAIGLAHPDNCDDECLYKPHFIMNEAFENSIKILRSFLPTNEIKK